MRILLLFIATLAILNGENLDKNLTTKLQNEHNKTINTINKNRQPQKMFLSKIILKEIESSKKDIVKKAITNHDKAKESSLNLKEQQEVIRDIKSQKFLTKNAEKSAFNSLQSLRSNHIINSIRLNNELATNERLAKAQNPYNQNLILANDINKGETNTIILMKKYAKLADKKSNFYKRFIGGKMTSKKSEISPIIQGIMFGYDIVLDSSILGVFASYTKSRVDTLLINSKTDNYQVGGYLRSRLNSFEIDARISGGISSGELQRAVVIKNQSYIQNSNNKGFSYAINADVGKIFSLSSSIFIKPIFGVYFNKNLNKGFSEKGVLAMSFSPTRSSKAGIKLAGEFRAYPNDKNFAYVRAGIYKDFYKNQNIAFAKFIDSNREFLLEGRAKRQNYIFLTSGIDLMLSQNTHINANFGITKTAKHSYYNGTISFKFDF